MHELSIAQRMIEIVREGIAGHPSTRVKTVSMEVGTLAAVLPESLQFCFETLVEGTDLEGTVLRIEEIPVELSCEDCLRSSVHEDICFSCTHCGSVRVHVVKGRELRITTIQIDEPSEVLSWVS